MFLSNRHYTLLNYIWASQNTDLLHYPLLYYLILLMQSVKYTQLFEYYLFISFICLSCSCICFCSFNCPIYKCVCITISKRLDLNIVVINLTIGAIDSTHIITYLNPVFCSEFRWLSNSFVYKVYYFLIFHYYIIILILPHL